MSFDSPLESPLTSSHPYAPLALRFSSSLSLSFSLHVAPHHLQSPFFSVCLLVFSGMAVGTGLKRGEGSIGAKAHKPIRRQRVAVAIGSRTAKLALLTWSSWLLFLLFRSWCAPGPPAFLNVACFLSALLPVHADLCDVMPIKNDQWVT